MIVEPSQRGTDRERRLERILADYLEAAGRGEAPDQQALLAAHPDFAADLAEFFDVRAKVQAVAASFRQAPPNGDGDGGSSEAASQAPALESGRIVGDYEVIRMIARGGMGIVYRARQRSLDRLVALKMLRDEGATPEELRRFRHEAEAIAQLDHPHIVPVHEVGEHDGHRFFSMKLVEGGSLADRIGDYADDPRAAARVVAAVARAIHHAHERGILHRDLKPSNVLIDEHGEPVVADFGLALQTRSDTVLTRTGLVPGTPAYMAPEQVDGGRDAVTPATDVHGLGTVLYALLTGRAPFGGETPWATLSQVRDHVPARPRTIRRSVARDLETICLKCLEKEPGRRYASAASLGDDLDRWLSGRPIAARPVGPVGRAWRFARRRPAIAGLAVVVFALGMTVLGLFVRMRERAELARRSAQALGADRSARDLAQAWRDWSDNRLESVRALIDRHRPSSVSPGSAGFAWRYLDRLAHVGRPPLVGHQGQVYSAAFSPDGRILATASEDRTVQLWDPIGGTLRSTLAGHTDEVASVVFSPDGRLIATASEDQTVRIWDATTGRALRTLQGHSDEVVAAVFSPDGRRLVSASRKGKVIFWDTATWRESRSFTVPNAPRLQGLAISPDGSTLAIAGRGMLIVDLLTGRERTRLSSIIDDELNSLAFSHDGRLLAGAGPPGVVILWNTRDWSRAAVWPTVYGSLEGVAFAPDDKTLAALGSFGLVHLIDPGTGAQDLIATGQHRTWCVAFSPDGRTLATGSSDRTVKLWDLPRDAMRIPLPCPADSLVSLEYSPDGTELTAADHSGGVWIYDARRAKLIKPLQFEAGSPIVQAMLSGDCRWLATESVSHGFEVRSLPDGRLRRGPNWRCRDHLLAISPSGIWIATATDATSALLLWSVDHGGLVGQPVPGDVRHVIFSPKGDDYSVLLRAAGHAVVGEVRSKGIRRARTNVHVDEVVSHEFSRDGSLLATGGDRGLIVVWDVATLEPVLELPGSTSWPHALDFSPDGRTLAAGHEDRLVTLWDLATGRRLMSLKGHSGPVWHVRFSPDGKTLATAAAASGGTTELFLWPADPPE